MPKTNLTNYSTILETISLRSGKIHNTPQRTLLRHFRGRLSTESLLPVRRGINSSTHGSKRTIQCWQHQLQPRSWVRPQATCQRRGLGELSTLSASTWGSTRTPRRLSSRSCHLGWSAMARRTARRSKRIRASSPKHPRLKRRWPKQNPSASKRRGNCWAWPFAVPANIEPKGPR